MNKDIENIIMDYYYQLIHNDLINEFKKKFIHIDNTCIKSHRIYDRKTGHYTDYFLRKNPIIYNRRNGRNPRKIYKYNQWESTIEICYYNKKGFYID